VERRGTGGSGVGMEARRPGVPQRAKPRPIMEQIHQPVSRHPSRTPGSALHGSQFRKARRGKKEGKRRAGSFGTAIKPCNLAKGGLEKKRREERDTVRELDQSLSLGEFSTALSASLFSTARLL